MAENGPELFTVDEAEAIIMAFLGAPGRRETGATEDEMSRVYELVGEMRMEAAMLSLILDGRVFIDLADDGTDLMLHHRDRDTQRVTRHG